MCPVAFFGKGFVNINPTTRFVNETLYGSRKPAAGHYERENEDSDLLRLEFRQPRDTLLCVVAEFLTKCSARLADLSKKIPDLPSKATELLDIKCHLVSGANIVS